MYKILVVDDDAEMLEMFSLLLNLHGYEVRTLYSGEKIFTEVREFEPDLILLDVMLAGMDGNIICSALKTSKHTQHIPIIFVSGYYQFASGTLTEPAADDFVLKPFDISNLLNKIEHQLAA